MNSGLYALAGDSATATLAACANRLDEPMTKVSNVYFGLSRLPSPPPLPARRSSRPVPGPTVARCAIGGGAAGTGGGRRGVDARGAPFPRGAPYAGGAARLPGSESGGFGRPGPGAAGGGGSGSWARCGGEPIPPAGSSAAASPPARGWGRSGPLSPPSLVAFRVGAPAGRMHRSSTSTDRYTQVVHRLCTDRSGPRCG